MCLWLCTISVHNTTQNSSDNLPSYLQTTIITQMLSIGGEGAILSMGLLSKKYVVLLMYDVGRICYWNSVKFLYALQRLGYTCISSSSTALTQDLSTSLQPLCTVQWEGRWSLLETNSTLEQAVEPGADVIPWRWQVSHSFMPLLSLNTQVWCGIITKGKEVGISILLQGI